MVCVWPPQCGNGVPRRDLVKNERKNPSLVGDSQAKTPQNLSANKRDDQEWFVAKRDVQSPMSRR